MFEHEEERDGKFHVPVRFTVNGTRIQRQGGLRFIKTKPDDPLYPFIGFDNQSRVLAKVKTEKTNKQTKQGNTEVKTT